MRTLFVSKPLVMEPLGLMYLSGAAKRAGHESELALTNQDLREKMRAFSPDVVGYSVMTGDQKTYLDINRKLKQEFKFTSIFGGPHPTFFPEMIEEPDVDVICRGEGEEAFVELLDCLKEKRSFKEVEGLHVKADGAITQNKVRRLADLDSLAFPDRELIRQIPSAGDSPIKHFIASRGCPFNCSYCFNEQYAELYSGRGPRLRFRDVNLIIREIREAVESSPTKFVYFQDDTFTLNRAWLREFSEKYGKEIGMPFHCHVRANTLDAKKVDFLKNAGCYSTHIAAETANDRIRNEILSRNMSREQITCAAGLLRDNGIRFMMQNMIGLPTGTLEDDISTLELNIDCRPDYAWVSIFQPYPGTRLGAYCREHGFYNGDFNDLEANFFDSSKLNFSEEYKSQLSNFQKLFAIFVEYPELHRLGLSRTMIDAERTPEVAESYKAAYREFRKKADELLFGFRL